uniref:EOG090X0B7I n=1 Tax=Evadne anonyx TaxID=141404 RepID=A0A9N6ZE73_9CRUS|nr:EOG090X0B7I [Evadne anonyx]
MDVTQLIQADPKFIDQIVNQIKSQGTFDQWRRECLADVDTKPAYQNLTSRVDNAVASFLNKQRWRPDMVKNQVRENLRRNILELGFIEKGVDRIVEQVVQPKILPLFNPAVESSIYKFLGINNPKHEKEETETENVNTLPKKVFRPMPVSVPIHTEDGTPPPGEEFDLEAITPSPETFPKLKKAASAEDLADEDRVDSPDSTSSDDFSSPEFEKLDIGSQSPKPTFLTEANEPEKEEKENEEIAQEDDHSDFRPKTEGHHSDRKPDEDEGNGLPNARYPSTSDPATVQDGVGNNTEPPKGSSSGQQHKSDKSKSSSGKSCDRSEERRRSSKERSRSKSESQHRSDRREHEHSSHRDHKKRREDNHKNRHRDSRDSRRDDSDRKHRSSSDRKQRDSKKSHRSDRDRYRDSKRRESESQRSKRSSHHGSSNSSKRKESDPDPSDHPQAMLWERPSEKPTALSDYLAQFPPSVFEVDHSSDSLDVDEHLTDVSASSVSSYEDSEAENFNIHLSEIEVDSEMEEMFVASGGRITYSNEISERCRSKANSYDYYPGDEVSPPKFEETHSDTKESGDNKRVRKLNSRYNDSYVGSEWKKMESIISSNHSSGHSNNLVRAKGEPHDFHDSGVSGSSPEEEEYPMADSKKMKVDDAELPSSPDSVESNPAGCDPGQSADPSEDAKDLYVFPNRTNRKTNGLKQPHQRYDDTDLYKPRPVITPSSRRSRRNSQPTP